jgi:hypothetical protein
VQAHPIPALRALRASCARISWCVWCVRCVCASERVRAMNASDCAALVPHAVSDSTCVPDGVRAVRVGEQCVVWCIVVDVVRDVHRVACADCVWGRRWRGVARARSGHMPPASAPRGRVGDTLTYTTQSAALCARSDRTPSARCSDRRLCLCVVRHIHYMLHGTHSHTRSLTQMHSHAHTHAHTRRHT